VNVTKELFVKNCSHIDIKHPNQILHFSLYQIGREFLKKRGQCLRMAKYRMVQTDFWKNPVVLEDMTPEDKLFYLYLLTNQNTTQIGIYRITKKQMAFDLGYSIETIQLLMARFSDYHKLIRYNPETRELAIKNWGKYNLQKGGKPVMDCMYSELKEVEDTSLIRYISESIQKQEIYRLYESFCAQDETSINQEVEEDTYLDQGCEEFDDTFIPTLDGQKEDEKQKVLNQIVESNPIKEKPLDNHKDVQELIEFWDNNGFGLSNMNAKQQLLAWLNDSSFLQPKQVILKAMNIACANNKRKLNYVTGILKNWENQSLLTVEEIDSYQDNQQPAPKHRQLNESHHGGRAIPKEFVLDITAGEDW
jgi:DnaD/phage-associated family protein